ncbi:polyprenyl synthetase family protein [soil metagenome]
MAAPAHSDEGFHSRLAAHRHAVELRLAELTPGDGPVPALLAEAARYAVLAPAKRLRSVLTLLAAEQFGGEASPGALDFGCALEMVHAASLVLDDLPCMDDARLRRGQPALHRRYGEDVAVLAAISLLNEAYAVTARAPGLSAEQRLLLVERLGAVIGFRGLAAGQISDLRDRSPLTSQAALHDLNHQKTGLLFVAAVEGGAIAAGAPAGALGVAQGFGRKLGEAFQILDDLIDVSSNSEAAGKDVGQDGGKTTVVSLIGPEAARIEMRRRLDGAIAHLDDAGPGPLSRFAEALFGAAPAAA